MKKLNNKGFAISGIMYSLLILIILLMFLALGVLANRRLTITKVIKDANDEIDNRDYAYMEHCFITPDDPYCNYAPTGRKRNVKLYAGRYRLEVWGADGGYGHSGHRGSVGGNGGYSIGIFELKEEEINVYVYVGVKPGDALPGNLGVQPAGFNHGGRGFTRMGSSIELGGTGGGATDIRVGEDSIYSRIIVAGGGGGVGAKNQAQVYPGGHGGGITGRNGSCHNTNTFGRGGTISKWGLSHSENATTGVVGSEFANKTVIGAFNRGGGMLVTGSIDVALGGGGGGWYGGGFGADGCSGGGGSGWIYTDNTYNAWRSANPTDANRYLLASEYYLTNANNCQCTASVEANRATRYVCTGSNNSCCTTATSCTSNSGIWRDNPATNGSGYARITACKIVMKDEDTGVEEAWILKDNARCPNYAADVKKSSCKGNAANENSCTVNVPVYNNDSAGNPIGSPIETNPWITYTCSTTAGTC